MTQEVQQLIDLITKMQDRQETAQKETNNHLIHLRENVHDIKNDYHGVSLLTQTIRKDVEDLKVLRDKDQTNVNSRITGHEKDMSEKLSSMDNKIATISASTKSYDRIKDNVSKAIITIIATVCVSAIAFFYNKGT